MNISNVDPVSLRDCINAHCSTQSIDDTINYLMGGIIDYQNKMIINSIELSTPMNAEQINFIDTFQICLDLFKSLKEL